MLVDTQGLLDSDGQDSEHMKDMVQVLQTVKFAHTILLCLNSSNERIDHA
jgi:predicted GTPase